MSELQQGLVVAGMAACGMRPDAHGASASKAANEFCAWMKLKELYFGNMLTIALTKLPTLLGRAPLR